MNKRIIGSRMEQRAAEYLQAQGFRIVERNFRNRQGEIDIIGYHEGYLVFVEVKYRKDMKTGGALAAVNLQKQRQICKVADYYRYLHKKGDDTMVRYDVVAFQQDEVCWIRNAFSHIYAR